MKLMPIITCLASSRVLSLVWPVTDRCSPTQDLGLPLPPTSNISITPSPSPALTNTHHPVIAIVGSTGTGKSQLGVEVAQHLASLPGPSSYQGAAILSSDSMQIYHNLDVITNKATIAEQGEVPHHLMSFLDPAKGERYDLQRFVREAKRVAEQECLDKGKVPIVVGGTIYWTQHLLCPGNVVERRGEGEDDNEGAGGWREPKDGALRLAFERMDEEQRKTWQNVVAGPLNSSSAETAATPSPREMHQLLTTLDPLMASRWHPLDGRKIANSLHVIARTGRRHSDWVKEQEQEQNDNAEASTSASIPHWSGKPLRTLLFWIYASRPELNARLDARVDKMIPRGLLDEIRTLRRIAAEARGPIDTSQGIFQAIGYKEFKPFLDALDDMERSGDGEAVSLLPAAGEYLSVEALPLSLRPLFIRGLDSMKSATRQYAKKQVGWMRNKLLPEIARTRRLRGEGVMEVVLLDATRPEEWEEKVRKPALKAVEAFMKGEAIPPECRESEAWRTEVAPFLEPEAEARDPSHSADGDVASSLNGNAHILCPICTEASLASTPTTASSKPGGEVFYRAADSRKHLSSKTHRGAMARQRKLERLARGEGLADLGEEAKKKRELRAALKTGSADANGTGDGDARGEMGDTRDATRGRE